VRPPPMFYGFTPVSRNAKTGPIPVSTSHRSTCPPGCPLKGAGCYAEHGPLRLVWDKVSLSLEQLCGLIRRLPRRQLWRYGQAGDLPGDGDEICETSMDALVRANGGRPVLAYTHKPPTLNNLRILREAADRGFVVNLSADDPAEADALSETGLPVVVVLPLSYGRGKETRSEYRVRLKDLSRSTPAGRKIAICPATYHETTCARCGICADPDRKGVIVGFPAHGSRATVVARRIT
jgi:hypothetical protein